MKDVLGRTIAAGDFLFYPSMRDGTMSSEFCFVTSVVESTLKGKIVLESGEIKPVAIRNTERALIVGSAYLEMAIGSSKRNLEPLVRMAKG